MAFEPADVAGLQDGVAQIYADAEVQLLARVAKAIEKGIDSPQWVSVQLAEIARLSTEARGFLLSLDPLVAQQIEAALLAAHATGVAAADSDVPGPPSSTPAPIVSQEAVSALAAEATAAVVSTHSQILRSTVDAYRQVVADVSGRVVTGVATRRDATQAALDHFAARGITSFRDKAGRNWRIDTYAEMAVRTAALRALKQGHTDRLLQRGYDLVVISSHPRPAPQCRKFEGRIVSLTGDTPNGKVEATSPLTGAPVTETVVASMREAQASGLHHPNCKHTHTLWVPGAPRPKVEPYDEQGYADEQKLRRLERAVREAKRQQAAAITPEAKESATTKVRARQAAIRDHVGRTGVPRRNHREQLRDGNAGNAHSLNTLTRNPNPPELPAKTEMVESKLPRRRRELEHLDDTQLADLAEKAVNGLDMDLLDRIEVEDQHRRKLAAKRAERWAGYEREYDELIAEGWDHESAVEKAYGISVKTQRSQAAISMLRGQGYEGKSFKDLSRHAYKDHAYGQWLRAEEATNGYMLSKAGQAAGIDPRSLWFGNAKAAEKYASEELRAFWDQHGRPTLDEFRADLLDPQEADRIRSARKDFLR
ncbi:phage minor capsid protein [Nocardia acidivorans]|uniref:phage minor capsid protein n=1 Tax=Nocardia acidivorans TaxID=404580 RepID=UPI000836AF3D|nr:phage minor capsid protein [Nocardia acidivorans]